MKLSEYKHLVTEPEADWLTALEAHAEDTGRPLDVVLAEALSARHREAGELEQALLHSNQTVARLRHETSQA